MSAELNIKNNNSQTPLHVAVANQNVDAAKELLVKGANRNTRDNDNLSAIDLN
jgi:ankyrin repeat protein